MTDKNIINILFIHANNHDVGGSDLCLFKLAATLDRSRFNPLVLLGLETKIVKKYRAYKIPLIITPMFRIRRSKNPFYLIKFALLFLPTVMRIVSLIKNYKIDILHSNDFLDIYGPIAARLAGVKSIQHDRLIMHKPMWLKKILCGIIEKFNHRIVVVSDSVGQAMFCKNSRIHHKVITCYDWLDMGTVGHSEGGSGFRKEIGVNEEHVLIGAVGRLEPWKGQHVFVKAAALVASYYPNARFVIVGGKVAGRGREKYEDKLRAIASKLKIKNKIFFTGHRNDISNVMEALDIYVHCSIEPDPLPGAVMEAMKLGKPVVGPRAGGVSEEVSDKETGILCTPGNYFEIAEGIIYLLQNPEMAKKMGKIGKNRAEGIFNKDALCAKMEGIYRELVDLYR